MDVSTFFIATAWILPIILAVTLHEASHGWVAEKFGDSTARVQGRVTFNPFSHIDPFGTVILPGLLLLMHSPVLLGYAKPVPVDFERLQPLRLGMLSVAIAGPGVNLLMAIISAIMLHFSGEKDFVDMTWWELNFFNAILINCALAVFNMLPILPLDGGRVLHAVLPAKVGEIYAKSEPYGIMIILALLFLPPMMGSNFFMAGLAAVVEWLLDVVFKLV